MKNRTLVHNCLARERTLNWTATNRRIGPEGWIILEGAYPDSCLDDPTQLQFAREVASGAIKAWLVSELPAVTLAKAMEMIEDAKKAGKPQEVLKAPEPALDKLPVEAEKTASAPVAAPEAPALVSAGRAPEVPAVKAEAPRTAVVEAAPTAGARADVDPNEGIVGMFTATAEEGKPTFSTPVAELMKKQEEVPIFPQNRPASVKADFAKRPSVFQAEPVEQSKDAGTSNLFAGASRAKSKQGRK